VQATVLFCLVGGADERKISKCYSNLWDLTQSSDFMTITHCCAFGTFPYHRHAPGLYFSSLKLPPIARDESDEPEPKRCKLGYDVTSTSTDKMDVDVSDFPLARDQHIEHNAVFRSDIQVRVI
jgi:hypothetical protein